MQLVSNLEIIDPFDPKLNHKMIICNINYPVNRSTSTFRQVRQFNLVNLACLNESFKTIPWQDILSSSGNDVESMVDTFYSVLKDELNLYVPIVKVKVRGRDKPGMTSFVKSLLRKSRKLNRIGNLTNNISDI